MNPQATRRRERALNRARARAGWAYLSEHAVDRARELGFHETEVLECIAAPENTYPCHPAHGRSRRIFQRGACCCVVDTTTQTVITVLIRTSEEWVHGHHTKAHARQASA